MFWVVTVGVFVGIVVTIWLNQEQVTEAVQAPMSSSSDSSSLQQARQAFWQRDVAGAEGHYRALAANDNANADVWGELGNVYYSQGKWREAAEAYAEAALILVENKEMAKAMYLHQLVMRMDGEQAMRIDEKLRAEFTGAAQ